MDTSSRSDALGGALKNFYAALKRDYLEAAGELMIFAARLIGPDRQQQLTPLLEMAGLLCFHTGHYPIAKRLLDLLVLEEDDPLYTESLILKARLLIYDCKFDQEGEEEGVKQLLERAWARAEGIQKSLIHHFWGIVKWEQSGKQPGRCRQAIAHFQQSTNFLLQDQHRLPIEDKPTDEGLDQWVQAIRTHIIGRAAAGDGSDVLLCGGDEFPMRSAQMRLAEDLYQVARVLCERGRIDKAKEVADMALGYMDAIGYVRTRTFVRDLQALIEAKRENPDYRKAIELCEEALSVRRAIGLSRGVAVSLRHLAEIKQGHIMKSLASGNTLPDSIRQELLKLIEESEEIETHTRNLKGLAFCALSRASIYWASGMEEDCRTQMSRANGMMKGKYLWMTEKGIDELLEQGLPLDVVRRLREQPVGEAKAEERVRRTLPSQGPKLRQEFETSLADLLAPEELREYGELITAAAEDRQLRHATVLNAEWHGLKGLFAGPFRNAEGDWRNEEASREFRAKNVDTFHIICKSGAMKDLLAKAERHASKPNVLICGETGTGKDVVARAIHAQCPWANEGPFVPVLMRGMTTETGSPLLGGTVGGLFTTVGENAGYFEKANGGTLFLDEIAKAPLPVQQMVLRLLETPDGRPDGERRVARVGGEERTFRVQVIAATDQDPERACAEGVFDESLYGRFARIDVPALHDHVEDIRPLAYYFLEMQSKSMGRPSSPRGIEESALKLLESIDYRFNVRGLRMIIRDAIEILAPEEQIVTERNVNDVLIGRIRRRNSVHWELPLEKQVWKKIEREEPEEFRRLMQEAWRRADGSKSTAAKLMGMSDGRTFANNAPDCGIVLEKERESSRE